MRKILTACIILVGSFIVSAATAYAYQPVPRPGELTGNHVRVRATPTLETNDNILFQVNVGQAVEILDIEGDFYRVNVRNYSEVYIFREFVSEIEYTPVAYEEKYEPSYESEYEESEYEPYQSEVKSVSQRSGDLVYDILNYAKSYIGTPYRFGSTDPARGFDCSGFVTVVMRQFGIYLQRSSASMASTNGSYVSRDSLEAGDLVFFATGGGNRVSHVGIYIGSNQFIHSASCVGVKISDMNESYYRSRFVRANRVL